MTATAEATPSWLPEKQMTYNSLQSQVAMTPRGDAVIVIGQRGGGPCARVRMAGGDWQPITCAPVGPGRADNPQVAVDAQGEATVVWEHQIDTEVTAIYAARLSLSTAVWQAPAALSDTSHRYRAPRIAVNAAGDAVVAWTEGPGTTDMASGGMFARRTGAGGSWTQPYRLRDADWELMSSWTSNPSVAIGAQQPAVAAWEGRRRSEPARLIRSWTGTGTAQTISPDNGQDAMNPDVAEAPGGGAVAVWQQQVDATTSVVEAAVRAPVSGLWQPPQSIDFGRDPQVATDAQGNATIVFAGSAGLRVSQLPSGSMTPLPPETLPGSNGGASPRLAVNADGAAVVAWMGNTVNAAVRPAGGTGWSSRAVSLHRPLTAAVAINAFGDVLSTWAESPPGVPDRIMIAGYDGAGPQLDRLEMPQDTHTGVPVDFSVAALDVWSGVSSTAWRFGDGATADGTSVSHAYAAGGVYPVTVTSTDSLGNSSSLTRMISVAGPPPPCSEDCDGDGYPASVDCDDSRAALHPGAVDVPGDGVDQDCEGGDAPNRDRDSDGYLTPSDCNDTNPKIHPDATEIPGNEIDEDCVGGVSPFPTLPSSIYAAWDRVPFRLTSLTVRKAIRGTRISVRCRGKGCPRATFVTQVRRDRNAVSVLGRLAKVHLRRGATVDVRVTKSGYDGVMKRIVVRDAAQSPRRIDFCLPALSTRPRRC
jgi:hypothetical protein